MSAHKWNRRLATLALVGVGALIGAVVQDGWAQNVPPTRANRTYDTYEPVNGKGGEEVSGPYQVVKGWPQPVTPGWTINAEGIYVDSPDRIISVGRGTRKTQLTTYWGPGTFRNLGMPIPDDENRRQQMIVVYNREGRLIESWDQWSSILPDVQQVQANPYDPEGNIWVATGESLEAFSPDGERHVKSLTVGDIPPDQTQNGNFVVEHFAWASNGDLYAAGGHRIVRFSKDGTFISAFGQSGNAPGQLGIDGEGLHGAGIHSVVIDSARNRMYVADRINSRIQVFDLNGQFLDAWPNIPGPYSIRLTADGEFLWVADGYTQKIIKYEAITGRLVPGSTWGTMGIAPGAIWGFHYFTTDSEGNLYVGEDLAFRIQKFVPRPDGSPVQLIGQLMQ
jgi:hypothetical protein